MSKNPKNKKSNEIYLYRLPNDVIKLILLRCSFEDIIEFTFSSKRLNQIYRDSYFWKNKIIRDYGYNRAIYTGKDSMLSKFLYLYSRKIQNRAKIIRELYIEDNKYIKIQKEINDIQSSRLPRAQKKITIDKLEKQLKRLKLNYENNYNNEINKSTLYKKNAIKIDTNVQKFKYKEIIISTNEQLNKFRTIFHNMINKNRDYINMEEVEDILEEVDLYNDTIEYGNLLVLKTLKKIFFFFYIDKIDADLVMRVGVKDKNSRKVNIWDLPDKLTIIYNKKEIERIYNLNFYIYN